MIPGKRIGRWPARTKPGKYWATKTMEDIMITSINLMTLADLSIDDLKDAANIIAMELKARKAEKPGRKEEVLDLLKQAGPNGISILKIAENLGINSKNVSSQLTYLRKSGVAIGRRSNGNVFIE